MPQPQNQPASVMTPTALHVAEIYAQALLGLPWEDGEAEQAAEQLDAIGRMLQEMPDVRDVLRLLSLNPYESRRFVERTFRGRVDDRVADFIGVLADHGRLGVLSLVPGRFRRLLDARKQKIPVTVTTAMPLTTAQQETLAAALSESLGQDVVLETEVDPELIGGLHVRLGDRVYDASLAGELRDIHDRLQWRGASWPGRGGRPGGA